MRITRHPDTAAWLADCAADLEADEARHSLMLGAARSGYGGGDPPYLAVVREGGALRLAALMIHPARLVLVGGTGDEPLRVLAADLVSSAVRVGSLNAPAALAEIFGAVWGEVSGARASVAMRQRLHALREVAQVPEPRGGMRPAGPDDTDLVAAWIAAFEEDALGKSDPVTARRDAERRLAAGEIVLWEDRGPCGMAARARRTRRTEAVNHVYTPVELRGRGYATALVAALSRRLLADGNEACVLFTDLANPTSNAIYARIGYRPLQDFTMLRFGR